MSLLVDEELAIDAGSLASGLTFEEQARLSAVLLSHGHYDHVRDVPAVGLSLFSMGRHLSVLGESDVLNMLRSHWINGTTYPRLHEMPAEEPTLQFHSISPGESFELSGKVITPTRMNHTIASLGFRIEDGKGRVMFYTSDTGPLPPTFWEGVSADLLIAEVTMPNAWQESAISAGHLTPELLKRELSSILSTATKMPRVIAVHMNPLLCLSGKLEVELNAVAREMGVEIAMGFEDMECEV